MDTYSHVTPALHAAAASKMQVLFAEVRERLSGLLSALLSKRENRPEGRLLRRGVQQVTWASCASLIDSTSST